jgi:hypothetical protein
MGVLDGELDIDCGVEICSFVERGGGLFAEVFEGAAGEDQVAAGVGEAEGFGGAEI